MSIKISNTIIRTGDEYLKYPRVQITNTMRKDLKDDIQDLCKQLDKPLSKGLDCLVILLQENPNIAEEYIDILLRY